MARRRGNMLEAFQVSREKSLQAQRAAEKAEQRAELVPSSDSVAQRLQRKVKGLTGLSHSEPGPDGLVRVESKSPLDLPKTSNSGGGGRSTRPVVDFPEPGAAAIKHEFDKSITLAMGPLGLFVSALALITISFWGGYRIGERSGAAGAGAEAGVGAQHAAWMDLSPIPLPDPGAFAGMEEGVEDAGTADLGVEGQANAADLAFEDPRNVFTLVVDQHNDNELGRERALANYQYLRNNGLPAIYPRIRGDVVYLLVGAYPESHMLDDLLQKVHALPYPGGPNRTFSTAFHEKIDNFF
ncbi:MAG: hypothetical protein ACI9X4_001985 [Glaciecola sp.]|jgi:hypothetical protein